MSNSIDYQNVMQQALLHGVVRETLRCVARDGLPGDHHFYIAFQTQYPGVVISEELLTQYPEEMIIVLQHRFWNLQVNEDSFSVDLTFNNVMQTLTVPFSAVRAFFDPSVDFGLQFDLEGSDSDGDESESDDDQELLEEADGSYGQVLRLDAFRKK